MLRGPRSATLPRGAWRRALAWLSDGSIHSPGGLSRCRAAKHSRMSPIGPCIKCNETRRWHVERIGIQDPQYSNGKNVPLGCFGKQETTPGQVDALVCAACGYTELYWQGLSALRHNPENGVHLIVAQATPPYR
jgi:hypothetical protein